MFGFVTRGGCAHAECPFGQVALLDTCELLAHLARNGWAINWPIFARKLRCTECVGRSPRVSCKVDGSAPTPPQLADTAYARMSAPVGVNPAAWARDPR